MSEDSTRVVCKTKAEWDVAYEAWNAAGRPGGRRGRPLLDAITMCLTCGGAQLEPELMPAFPCGGNFCTCSGRAPHSEGGPP